MFLAKTMDPGEVESARATNSVCPPSRLRGGGGEGVRKHEIFLPALSLALPRKRGRGAHRARSAKVLQPNAPDFASLIDFEPRLADTEGGRAQPPDSLRSSPRKRGPRITDRGSWIPASAGMNGSFVPNSSPQSAAAASPRARANGLL